MLMNERCSFRISNKRRVELSNHACMLAYTCTVTSVDARLGYIEQRKFELLNHVTCLRVLSYLLSNTTCLSALIKNELYLSITK